MECDNSSEIDINSAVTNVNNIILNKPTLKSRTSYTPIKYTENYSAFTNILLVDSTIANHNDFFKNSNSNTFPVIYDSSSKSDELYTFIKTNFKNVICIGLVFDGGCVQTSTMFLNELPFFNNNDLTATTISDLSTNAKFIVDLINQLGIKNIDYLSRGTLTSTSWVNYYGQINKFTKTKLNLLGVTVGASNNTTGNIKYGPNWITESDEKNVHSIYFKSSVANYTNVLGIEVSTISASGTLYVKQLLNKTDYFLAGDIIYDTEPSFARGKKILWNYGENVGCKIKNIDAKHKTLTVNFRSSIDIQIVPDSINGYIPTQNIFFICGSENITFDGNFNDANCVVSVDNKFAVIYPGFIQNGTIDGNRYDYITVQNIIINSVNSFSVLYSNSDAVGGWICQAYFGTNTCIVNNCSSNASINNETGSEEISGGGGILGDYCVATVNNCYSTGIIGKKAGGIFGLGTGSYNNGNVIIVTANNCYSTGVMLDGAGGIFGFQAGSYNSGTMTITAINCYSEGTILNNAGGIFGSQAGCSNFAGTTIITATNCYSEGAISSAGGIFGSGVANNNSGGKITVTATYCYSVGIINSYSGGIFGDNAGYNNTGGTIKITASNCYSTGAINSYGGGIFGDNAASSNYGGEIIVNVTNCYSTGAMSDSSAGGIFGSNADTFNTYSKITVTATNCYTSGSGTQNNGIFGLGSSVATTNCFAETRNEGSQWNTVNAQTVLEHYNTTPLIDTVWLNVNPYNNTPFLLYGSDPQCYNTNFYITSSVMVSNTTANSLVKTEVVSDYFWVIPPRLIQLLILHRDK